MNFCNWLETFLTEKNFDRNTGWELQAPNGMAHFIGADVVIEAMMSAPKHEQKAIKATLVKIDFINGNVAHYFRHLAQALVNNY